MSERAQTTLDFAIGVSVFAAVLLFVFTFVPGLLSPFTVGVQEDTVASNRVVDGITSGTFGSPAEPGVLDTACTVWFFENAGGGPETPPTECGFTGETLQERLGLEEDQSVNVTISGNITAAPDGSSILCWNADDGLAERGSVNCGADSVVLAAGGSVPERNDDVIGSQRVAALETEDVTVTVELW